MSAVCYCGQPDCPVTTWEHDACVANLRAERDALKAQVAELKAYAQRAAKRNIDFGSAVFDALGLEGADWRDIALDNAAEPWSRIMTTITSLKAQVEAARSHLSIRLEDWARFILEAMDEAAKKYPEGR